MKFANKSGLNKYEILLHGVVGGEMNGVAIAHEMKLLNEMGATDITLRINSVGGSIQNGYSIVGAILNSEATIHTVNEGTADSMALVILAAGDSRSAYDYASGIIHDPLVNGVTLAKIKDQKTKAWASNFKNSLLTIISGKSGKSLEELSAAMTEEIMLDADGLMEYGIIDFVKESVKRPQLSENMSAVQRMVACSNFLNKKKMTEVTNLLGLSADANESAVVNEVTKLQSQVADLTNEKNEAVNKAEEADKTIEELEAKIETYQKQAVESAVSLAINSGKFEESDRESLTALAENGLEAFNTMVTLAKLPHTDITDEMGESSDPRKDWTLEDWSKNDPEGLRKMQIENLNKFNKLYNAE